MRRTRVAAAVVAAMACILAGAAAERASALVPTCSPSMNGPGSVAPGTVIAPNLRVIKSSHGIGNCDSAISTAARSADGTIWGVDQGSAKNGLWKSTDELGT